MTLSTGAASLDAAHCAYDLLGGEFSDALAAEAPAAGYDSVLIVTVWHHDRLVARTRELQCGLCIRYRRQCFYRMSVCAAMHSLSIAEQDWLGPLRDLLEAAGAAGETQPGWAQRVVWGLGEAIKRQGARRRGATESSMRGARHLKNVFSSGIRPILNIGSSAMQHSSCNMQKISNLAQGGRAV